MGTILFEIGVPCLIKGIRYDIIFAFLTLFVAFFIVFKKKNSLKEKKSMIALGVVCIMLFSSVSTITRQYKEYTLLKKAYETNSCLYVEGVIYDYRGHPDTAQWYEEFWVDGVFFSYDLYEVAQGYNLPQKEGGVIAGNGQKVKIGYVPVEIARELRNKIVYIEQIE